MNAILRLLQIAPILLLTAPSWGQRTVRDSMQPPQYTLTDLGDSESGPLAMNDLGSFTGQSKNSRDGYLQERNRRYTIKTPKPYQFCKPIAVNDQNCVAGTMELSVDGATLFDESGIFLWQHGRLRILGPKGFDYAEATAMNSLGEIVGTEGNTLGSSYQRAFLWRKGKFFDLGSFNPSEIWQISGQANAINDKGQVVGTTGNAIGDAPNIPGKAILWSGGHVYDLGNLGGADAFADDINNRGEIVGSSATATPHTTHAFLFKNWKMQDLGAPAPGWNSSASCITESGQVIGFCDDNGSEELYLWQSGHWYDLQSLIRNMPKDWNLTEDGSDDISVNRKGQILVWGSRISQNPNLKDQTHAFLLTPIAVHK